MMNGEKNKALKKGRYRRPKRECNVGHEDKHYHKRKNNILESVDSEFKLTVK